MSFINLFRSNRHPGINPNFARLSKAIRKIPGRRYHERSRWLPHQGERETARRRRQIEAGHITINK
jgi:hypothetical protein